MNPATLLSDLALLAPALLVAGVVTGLLAGLFGVGGGAVMVPVLYEVFGAIGVTDEVRMPLCVGTSLAVIVPTSIRSFKGHQAKGAVDMEVLKAWVLPILAGVIAGALIARHAEPWVFKLVFVVVAGLNAFKLLFGKDSWRIGDTMPGRALMSVFGVVIGVLSSLMGIGGGVLSNMIMSFYGTPIHRSVATSSGVGVLISIPASLGYVYAGWPKMDLLPPGSLGYISFIGFALLIPTTVLAAPYGVKIAHALEKRKLEMAFGIFLLLVALRFLVSLLWE